MTQVTILLADDAAALYQKVAQAAEKPLETVLADALYRLAGELSLQVMREQADWDDTL